MIDSIENIVICISKKLIDGKSAFAESMAWGP